MTASEPRACCQFHHLPSKTPPCPSNTGSSAAHCCSARCVSLATSRTPRGKLRVLMIPTPWSAASPCSQGCRSCQACGADSARERRRSSPSFVCARAWGGGKRGRSLSICLPRLCPGRSKCGGGGGIPSVGAGSRGAPRFQSHSGSGPTEGTARTAGTAGTLTAVVPSSWPAASASLRPCHPNARSGVRPGAERDGEHE